jgi:hypothetical protein
MRRMPMTDAEKRAFLFDRFAKNFTLYHPQYVDVFCCPLCQRGLNRKALGGENPYVSLAHILPRSLGGTACTLTCTQCNNFVGSELEAALVESLKHEARIAGHAALPNARMKGPFGHVGVELRFAETNTIQVIEKQSNPADFKRMKEFFAKVDTGEIRGPKLNLSFRVSVSKGRAAVALYHAAFLLMFSYFGYEYALRKCLDGLREQVRSPDKETWKTQIGCPVELSNTTWTHHRRSAVIYLRERDVLLTCFRLKAGAGPETTLAVVMPALSETLTDVPLGQFESIVVPYDPKVTLSNRWIMGQALREWQKVA